MLLQVLGGLFYLFDGYPFSCTNVDTCVWFRKSLDGKMSSQRITTKKKKQNGGRRAAMTSSRGTHSLPCMR